MISVGTYPLNHIISVCVLSFSARVPEVTLPNFFMPPLELERAMRSLRVSALTRPPPRELFHSPSSGQPHPPGRETGHLTSSDSASTHPPLPQSVRTLQDVASTLPQSVRTLQDVDQFLRSRRGASGHHQTLSDKETQRLSRIFSSKPLQTTSET